MGNSKKTSLWMLGAFLIWAIQILSIGYADQDSHALQPVQKTWRLGVFFWHESPNDEAAFVGIREAFEESGRLHELIVQQAGSDRQRAIEILQQFRSGRVDLIFAMGTDAALLAAEHVVDTPIVFTAVTNPVESGVTPSWEGSGRNLAGNSNWIASETVLHIFRLAVPKLSRLGMLRSKISGVVSAAELQAMKTYLRKPDAPAVEIVEETVDGVKGIRPAVKRLAESRVEAIWIPIDFLIYENMEEVLCAAQPHGLPLVSSSIKGMMTGAVAGVVVDYKMLGKQAAVIALDILERSVQPGKIPVGTVKGFQVIVNIGAARRCNYELPLPLLVFADSILKNGTPQESKNER